MNQKSLNMKIALQNENPYSDIICRFFSQSFPKIFKPNKADLLEIITDLLVSTKENRYGPIPKPESLVVIRSVIRESIEDNSPIPILVPWGGIKASETDQVDIAEIGGIMQLINLDNAVKEIYPKGLNIHVRIEDLGADWLYRHSTDPDMIKGYTKTFEALGDMLTKNNHIIFIPESSGMARDEYFRISASTSHLISEYLEERQTYGSDHWKDLESFEDLKEVGWNGIIPQEQVDYYLGLYRKLYPEYTEDDRLEMFCDYMGGALARYTLNGRCEPAEKYIQITFVPPIPGAPEGIFNNTLYWRTLPASNARTHIAAWRGRGYLAIDGNSIKMKITEYSNTELINNLIPDRLILSDGNVRISINADYLILS